METKRCQHQRYQDAAVEQQIRAVMQRVRAHRVGAGFADHPVLQHQQRHGHHQRKHNHTDAQPRRADRFRMLQTLVRLVRDQRRTAGDKQRLGHACQ